MPSERNPAKAGVSPRVASLSPLEQRVLKACRDGEVLRERRSNTVECRCEGDSFEVQQGLVESLSDEHLVGAASSRWTDPWRYYATPKGRALLAELDKADPGTVIFRRTENQG